MKVRKIFAGILCTVSLILLTASLAFAQARSSLRGSVSDEFGAVIVGATVTLTDASGVAKTATSNADGAYVFNGLAPGKYTIHAAAAGFATSADAEVQVAPTQRQPMNITLKVAVIESQVRVNAETPLSTDSANNANQTVISGRDLDALPDDPDEMAAALQALAGPSIGPNGGQIFIDGFSSGNMPPKESIREIRINQNPFAAENDQPSARIDILTKPGTDKMRGSASFNFNDESLNSRNPFQTSSPIRTPFQIRQLGFNLSGPIKARKASFFFEANRNDTDDNDLLRATILDPSFNIVQVGQGLLVPRRFTSFSPRLDYAINPTNTLVARYSYNHNVTRNNGLGSGFSLPERGYTAFNTSQVFQVTETAVLNATTINETRFQFSHNHGESLGDTSRPVLAVSAAFTGGGTQVGHSMNDSNRWELQNFTQIQKGNHTIKFGGRIRGVNITDVNPFNFGGQWVFTGSITSGLTSIQRYQKTLQLMQAGMSAAQIRAAGGGAAQFSINTGSPLATVSQFDIEPYIQDDWRYKPNLMFSYGLRYEVQNNASSKMDFAPRLAFAWSPGAGGGSTKPPKTVIRAGTGIFYNRFNEGNTLQTRRLDGVTEQQFVFAESSNPAVPTDPTTLNILNSFRCVNGTVTPDCTTNVPSIAGATPTQVTIVRLAPTLQIPTVYVLGGQVERQLPHNFTVTIGAYGIRILHVIRQRDINAPLPGTITAATPSGIRPNPSLGEIYQYEASGRLNQRQLFIGFNSRLNPSFSLNGNYVLSKTSNDTDGQGSNSLPPNSYDLTGEYGRGGFDVRHRFFLFGTYSSKIWKLTFAPFIQASSGVPFNITTGVDSNLDRAYSERPSFAGANANCSLPNIKCTRFGNFNLTPAPGEQIIPRNYGQGPSSFTLNMRITRTFGFVDVHKKSAASSGQSGQPQTDAAKSGSSGNSKGGGPGVRGPMIAGGGGPAAGHGPGGGGGMMGGFGGAASSEKKYTLTASIYFQNLLNNVNLAPPVGNLSSPLFGQSQSVAGSFGGFGGGGGGSANAGNRRIYLNLRLSF
jgi:Carboxypeptidase regulatory-like domain